MKCRFIALFIITALLCTLSAGCSNAKKLTESDVSYAGPILDNILSGIKDKDYDKFSKDFSTTLKNAITKSKFEVLVDTLNSKIGDYNSRTFSGASKTRSNNMDMDVVVYNAKFSKESGNVLITISFSGSKLVEGLYFSSPNLAK